ncbi:MAG TPA: hypothetical protein VMZ52_15470, partial [Bryobacteraceae bacterium]|nr:hypothetical protein [Bryobacteraceae bacterium]
TVFHRRERDGIDFVRRSAGDLWRATNFQHLTFTGVEASVTANPGRAQVLEVQYTGLHGAQDALTGFQSKYAFNYPIHSGIVSWQASLPGGIAARARLGALERYARDPYALLDLYAAGTRGKLHPFIQLSNVSDTVYEEIFGVRMPGRSLLVGVEWKVFTLVK